MRYIKLSLQYMTKNFLSLFAVLLVPSIILGLTTEPSSMVRFFVGFKDSNYDSFGQIFFDQSELKWRMLLISLLCIPLIIVFISGACGMVSRHMRLGVLDFKNFNRRINNNFILILKSVIVILIISQLYAVFCTSTTFLWVKVIPEINGALTMTIITNVLAMLTVVMLFAIFCLAIPTMSVTGLGLRRALAESMSMVKGHYIKMLFAIIFPMIIPYAALSALAAFDYWWRIIIYPFFFLLTFSYYISFLYVTYFDIADVDRDDLKNKYVFN